MKKFILFLLYSFFFVLNLSATGLKATYYNGHNLDLGIYKETIDQTINFNWTQEPYCAQYQDIGTKYKAWPYTGRRDQWSVKWTGYIFIPENKKLGVILGNHPMEIYIDNEKYSTQSKKNRFHPSTKKGVYPSPGLHQIELITRMGAQLCQNRYIKLAYSNNDGATTEIVPTQNLFPYMYNIQFTTYRYVANETDPYVEVGLMLDRDLEKGDVIEFDVYTDKATKDEIQYFEKADIAKEGVDYKAYSTRVKFDSTTGKTITLKLPILIDNEENSQNKIKFLALKAKNQNMPNIVINKAFVGIYDDESMKVSFLTDYGIENEPPLGKTKLISVPVVLNSFVQREVTVNLEIQNGTAKEGKNFKYQTSTITIKPGEESARLNITLMNDNEFVPNREFKINILNAYFTKYDGTQKFIDIGDIKQYSLTITDNTALGECVVNDTTKTPYELGWRRLYAPDRKFSQNTELNWEGDRLTIEKGYVNSVAGITKDDLKIPTKGNMIEIEFDYYSYGGCLNKPGLTSAINRFGGIGMALVLYDGNLPTTPFLGAAGAGLGYTRSGVPHEKGNAFTGGWLAIGMHQDGNFAVPDFGKNRGIKRGKEGPIYGTPFTMYSNRVTIRGSINTSTNSDNNHRFIVTSQKLSTGKSDLSTDGSLGQALRDWWVVVTKPSPNYYAGKFKIEINNRYEGKTYVKVLRAKDGKNFTTVIDQIDVMNGYGQRDIPEFIKLALTTSTTLNTCNKHQIANLKVRASTCGSEKSNKNNNRVVERQFVEKHKSNPTKYDWNWLWNSPLRTKIAGGAPNKQYNEKKIGYEYCVIAGDNNGDTAQPYSYPRDINLTYTIYDITKDPNNSNINDLYSNNNAKFLPEQQLKNISLKTNPNDLTAACFTLPTNFTIANITKAMYFTAYDKNTINTANKFTSSNNTFAIRPAGFYMTFNEAKIQNNTIVDYGDEKLPLFDFIKSMQDTTKIPLSQIKKDENSTALYNKFKDYNSSIVLKANTPYKVNLYATNINLDSSNKKYRWSKNLLTKYNSYIDTNYNEYLKINTSFMSPIVEVFDDINKIKKNLSCSNISLFELGKTLNNGKKRLAFRNGKLNYKNSIDQVKDKEFSKKTDNYDDYIIQYNDVMLFENNIADTKWTIYDYENIINYNKGDFEKFDKKNFENSVAKYGYLCKGYKAKGLVAQDEFDDEIVSCTTDIVNPRYIEFVPNKFDIYLTRILNQSKIHNIGKDSLEGGFTYYNDLMEDLNKTYNHDKNKLDIENQMSAKLQIIIAASDGKENSYPNFTDSCYAKDIVLNLSYIGDRNFKYKDNIKNNTTDKLSPKEISLMENAIKTFNKTKDNYKENSNLEKDINQKTEFSKYIDYKEQNLLSQTIKEKIKKEEDQKFLDTDKIVFNVSGFYDQKENKENKNILCKDTKNTKKCSIKIVSSYENTNDINKDKENFNADRNSYKTKSLKRDNGKWDDFTFANRSDDKFDDKNVSIRISKNFFNDEISFINKDYKKEKLSRNGATSVMIGFNIQRDEDMPMNPTKVFTRDFITNSLLIVSDENSPHIFIIPTDINIHYYNHDDNQSALFYYGSAYAKDAKGSRDGIKHIIDYTAYCTKNCDIFDINTSYNNTVLIPHWYKTPDYTPTVTTTGDIYNFISKESSTTTTSSLDKYAQNINIKAPDDKNVDSDTITFITPTYLKYQNTFNVEFIKDNENLWFGDGSVGSAESDESKDNVGKVLGTDKDNKFDKNLNKNSNRIFW
ncbi:Calx-beta domain-containing protein [Campylobacter sputorum]|uniref:Calx-beta domain-containing protein n=1 Tax=Campylobacter sputorum TaxID=206 RepID=UPI00187A4CB2|nr:Calx-beta domain-containing protein [Campylobacter sp. RM11302]MBE7357509.1 hypothetical protein [Campylobacter sp. RM11302]